MSPKELEEQDLLLQLAEESAELSQACSKLARHIRGVNPTGKSEEECAKKVIEELSDVLLCAAMLPYRPDWQIIEMKKKRWEDRLNDAREKRSAVSTAGRG